MKKSVIFFWFSILIVGILISGSASAAFNLKNESLERDYNGGESLRGFLTFKFENQRSDSLITGPYNWSIELLDFLLANGYSPGNEFNCTLKNCQKNYLVENQINSISLVDRDEKKVGFKIQGTGKDIIRLNSLNLNITTDAQRSCTNQISVGIIDENFSYKNQNYVSNYPCGQANYGCFDKNLNSVEYDYPEISADPIKYCENITLPASAAYKIGAKIINGSKTANVKLNMNLYDSEKNRLGGCILPSLNQTEQELSCIVNYTGSRGNYFACISSSSYYGDYKIPYEQSGETCGTDGLEDEGNSYDKDYWIFGQGLSFDIPRLSIDDSIFLNSEFGNLNTFIDSYIETRYGRNCSDGCYIPIVIKGNQQQVTFNNLMIKYYAGNTLKTDNRIYTIKENPSLINAASVSLNMQYSNFSFPLEEDGEVSLDLKLGNDNIFSNPVELNVVSGFEMDLGNKMFTLGQPSILYLVSMEGIASSSWTFSDSLPQEVNGSSISHVFTTSGETTVTVQARTNTGKTGTRTFTIFAGNAEQAARNLVEKDRQILSNITKTLSALPEWYNKAIMEGLNLTSINQSLEIYSQNIATNLSTTNYEQMVTELLSISLPEIEIKDIEVPFSLGYNYIDPSLIKDYDSSLDSTKVAGSAITWADTNWDKKVSVKRISFVVNDQKIPVGNAIKLTLTKKGTNNDEQNLYLNSQIDNLVFKDNYSQFSTNLGTGIPLRGNMEINLFSETEFENLGMFISPSVEKFGLTTENITPVDEPKLVISRWKLILGWGGIAFLFLVIYLALQEWYKSNYERSLFKSEDELYNIIHFIHNSRQNKLSDRETARKLDSAGWSHEQINYAFRKIDGKRTGMFEIPLFKFAENNKVRDEIAKRQQNSGDVRFIKRPEL